MPKCLRIKYSQTINLFMKKRPSFCELQTGTSEKKELKQFNHHRPKVTEFSLPEEMSILFTYPNSALTSTRSMHHVYIHKEVIPSIAASIYILKRCLLKNKLRGYIIFFFFESRMNSPTQSIASFSK